MLKFSVYSLENLLRETIVERVAYKALELDGWHKNSRTFSDSFSLTRPPLYRILVLIHLFKNVQPARLQCQSAHPRVHMFSWVVEWCSLLLVLTKLVLQNTSFS